MQNFLVLIREDIQKAKEMTEEEMQRDIAAYTQWVEELSKNGNYVSGEPLEPHGIWMEKDTVLTDGPFIEAKDAISGFFVLKAENQEELKVILKSCPIFTAGGLLEIRPIMQY